MNSKLHILSDGERLAAYCDEGEYDIVMYNGDTVALIEVKYKAHTKDIAKLLKNEPQNFRQTFTEYKDYKFYLGLAQIYESDLEICCLLNLLNTGWAHRIGFFQNLFEEYRVHRSKMSACRLYL